MHVCPSHSRHLMKLQEAVSFWCDAQVCVTLAALDSDDPFTAGILAPPFPLHDRPVVRSVQAHLIRYTEARWPHFPRLLQGCCHFVIEGSFKTEYLWGLDICNIITTLMYQGIYIQFWVSYSKNVMNHFTNYIFYSVIRLLY